MRWVHAIQVHRGVLGEGFTYELEEPFEDELEPVAIELAPYEGEAPPQPSPPEAMSDDELDAVFADHPVERCGPEHRVGRGGEVDGPLSDDPDVAAAQEGRAEHGLASDEASTRDAMERDDLVDGWDFPLLPEEQEASQEASRVLEDARVALEAEGWDPHGQVVPMVDRSEGIRPAVVVGPEDEDAVREVLERELGDGAVHIEVTHPTPAEAAAAQEAVTELMGPADEPGAITSVSGPPGHAQVGMVDPTREALDAIATVVDPDHVCVEVQLSGVVG